jgi:excisionase family DNA binding protein
MKTTMLTVDGDSGSGRLLGQKVGKSSIARLNSVSTRTVENWMKKGLIPYTKIGGVVRFDLAKVDAALARFEVTARA